MGVSSTSSTSSSSSSSSSSLPFVDLGDNPNLPEITFTFADSAAGAVTRLRAVRAGREHASLGSHRSGGSSVGGAGNERHRLLLPGATPSPYNVSRLAPIIHAITPHLQAVLGGTEASVMSSAMGIAEAAAQAYRDTFFSFFFFFNI